MRHFTESRQVTAWRHHGRSSNHRIATSREIVKLQGGVIAREIVKPQIVKLQGGVISREIVKPQHGVIAREIVKLQDGVISREIGKLQDWSFNGRSTNRRIGRFTGDFTSCQSNTLFIAVSFF